jgi:hypothetical protein
MNPPYIRWIKAKDSGSFKKDGGEFLLTTAAKIIVLER